VHQNSLAVNLATALAGLVEDREGVNFPRPWEIPARSMLVRIDLWICPEIDPKLPPRVLGDDIASLYETCHRSATGYQDGGYQPPLIPRWEIATGWS
jgi:hypothetical protein